jgi:3-hydroxybutyryl-CoA dehydratase
MDSPLFFDDFQVGQVWASPSRTVTETDVVNFANITGDFNPLHVDFKFAAQSPYRKPIAHGLLGMSWVAGLGSNYPNVKTVAFTSVREWHFTRPIFFGDTVHVETVCMEKSRAGKRAGRVVWHRKLINDAGLLVQEGLFETLVAIGELVDKPHFLLSDVQQSQTS